MIFTIDSKNIFQNKNYIHDEVSNGKSPPTKVPPPNLSQKIK